jgi:hypothetical protein
MLTIAILSVVLIPVVLNWAYHGFQLIPHRTLKHPH